MWFTISGLFMCALSTANTLAINTANAITAKNATELSGIEYANDMLAYRDLLSYSFKAGENEADRIRDIAVASINASSSADAATITADAASSAAWGKLALEVAKSDIGTSIKDYVVGLI